MKIRFSFDDGSEYDLKTADMLKRYDFDATFYIPANWQKYLSYKTIKPLSEEEVLELSKAFTIGSHGVNHELLTRVPENTQIVEIFGSKEFWNARNIEVTSFCYPRGYYNENIKALVKRAGYTEARTTKVCEVLVSDPYETHTAVHIGLDRQEYGTDWLTYAKRLFLDNINTESAVFHCWGHSEEIHRLQQWDRFGSLLRFLHENTPS